MDKMSKTSRNITDRIDDIISSSSKISEISVSFD